MIDHYCNGLSDDGGLSKRYFNFWMSDCVYAG